MIKPGDVVTVRGEEVVVLVPVGDKMFVDDNGYIYDIENDSRLGTNKEEDME